MNEINSKSFESVTVKSIIQAAKREFYEYGYKSSSLRRIVKDAGVTTGAFYGYFKNKEELFDYVVGCHADIFIKKFVSALDKFEALPADEQPCNMGEISGSCMDWMVNYVYKYPKEFKIILLASEGTKYANFIHEMVDLEVKATENFISVLKGLGYRVKDIDPKLEHILVSGMFSAFFEMIIHDMPYERACEYIKQLKEFHTAGWMKIIGL